MRALVIEGGGMRAAYANGVLAAFEDAGHRPFDAVYGTSAGAALAAWYGAGQARYALDTWRYVRDRRVLSYRRFLTGRGPLLDHDGMFRIIYETEMPLDVDAVRRAPHAIHATVTDADTGAARYPDVREGPVLPWLRASGRLPLACGPPVEVAGRRYLDGGIADPIPLAKAIADGATDVTLILNRPRGPREPEPALVSHLVSRRYPALAGLTRAHHTLNNEANALAYDPPRGVTVRVVRPGEATGAGRLSRDYDGVERAIRMGERDGAAYLARREPRVEAL